MNDDQLRRILDHFGLSWTGYRKVRKGVIRRLVRHMQQEGVRDAGDYLERIRTRPALRRETKRLLTVSVSRFFRDRLLWEFLQENLLPHILSRNPDRVSVWSAGCALGQEAYSFVMLWRSLADATGPLPPLSVLATDMNREYLERAASGIFARNMVKEVPEDCLNRFFQFENDRYAIGKDLRDCISWMHHDLTDVPPRPGPFHIIFMRNNLLTYYRREDQPGPVKGIVGRLITGGYLIIGARERLPGDDFGLSAVADSPGVYRKI
jgi:chemotaxis methyl-accepting protein methylase